MRTKLLSLMATNAIFIQVACASPSMEFIHSADSPIAFLRKLERLALEKKRTGQDANNFIVNGRISHWVKRKDLQGLASELANTKPCLGVVRWQSSIIYHRMSSIGEQSYCLLASFLDDFYPNESNTCPPMPEILRIKTLLDKENIVYPSFANWEIVKRVKETQVSNTKKQLLPKDK